MAIPDGFRLSVEDAPSRAHRLFIDQALDDLNAERWPNNPIQRIAVFVRDLTERIAAGLDGVAYGGWLFVNNLWVSEPLRGQGIGRMLIVTAESEALKRGCHSAWLDTFSFQAPGFYQKLGYEIFAALDYPPEHKRYFLRKRLTAEDDPRRAIAPAAPPPRY